MKLFDSLKSYLRESSSEKNCAKEFMTLNPLSGLMNLNRTGRKILPTDESDYGDAAYYVDKTLLIKEILDNRAKCTLFARPEGFGKTMNMRMLKSFFEISEKETSRLFTDKLIWKEGEAYRRYQGKFPVIYLSFKDVKSGNWEDALSIIKSVVSKEYSRHSVLEKSSKLCKIEKNLYRRASGGNLNEVELCSSLLDLSIMLDKHYGIPPIAIVDDYDIPIHQGDEAANFMSMFLSAGLKDNSHVKFSFMTGIMTIPGRNNFSGLNNVITNTVFDDRYSRHFGFTEDEVRKMAGYYRYSGKTDEIRRWYGGYRFGNTDMYNPRSVLNYFRNGCITKTYWPDTENMIRAADDSCRKILSELLRGNEVRYIADTSSTGWNVLSQEKIRADDLLNYLLMTGYVKTSGVTLCDGRRICDLSVPNEEMKEAISKAIGSI